MQSITSCKLEIQITNSIGQEIFKKSIATDFTLDLPIDVATWKNGIYFITITDEKGITNSGKILVQH